MVGRLWPGNLETIIKRLKEYLSSGAIDKLFVNDTSLKGKRRTVRFIKIFPLDNNIVSNFKTELIVKVGKSNDTRHLESQLGKKEKKETHYLY